MAERFYINCPLRPGVVVLEGPEAHHLAAVSRSRAGDVVCLFNGDGCDYPAQVVAIERRAVTLEVQQAVRVNRELAFTLEVAAPLPKGDRAQFLVEKLTELGVTRFAPLRTRRSIVQLREAKLERLQRQVIEASKQCGRNVLMRVEPLVEWNEYCRACDVGAVRLLAHPTGADSNPVRSSARTHRQTVCIAIGPEGGFTDEEVSIGIEAGWQPLNLGPRFLRVETAALVLAAWVVALRNGA